MIQVVIADDDKLILDNIADRIDWFSLGFQVVGKASNGEQALTLIREKKPELLVIDVVMPLMNGLEVTRIVRKEFPMMRVLVISSYEEFEYVKEAISLGAIGYTLKSELFENAFRQRLLMLAQDISKNRENNKHLRRLRLERYFNQSWDTVGSTDFDSIERGSDLIDEKCDYAVFFEWQPFRIHEDSVLPDDESTVRDRVLDACGDDACLRQSFYAGDLLIIGADDGKGNKAFWKSVSQSINRFFRRELSFVYGLNDMNIAELRVKLETYSQPILYMSHFRTDGEKCIDTIERSMPVNGKYDYVYLLDENASDAEIERQTREYIECLRISRNTSSVETFLKSFVMQLEIIGDQGKVPEEYRYFSNENDLRTWCMELYRRKHRQVRKKADRQYSGPVAEASRFIIDNYGNPDLRLEEIALHASISASRLQVIFKKEMGKTISDYITDIRLGEAVKLLETTAMKVYEVAEAVGYSSSQYFSQVLLQKTGKKPLDYRRTTKG